MNKIFLLSFMLLFTVGCGYKFVKTTDESLAIQKAYENGKEEGIKIGVKNMSCQILCFQKEKSERWIIIWNNQIEKAKIMKWDSDIKFYSEMFEDEKNDLKGVKKMMKERNCQCSEE